MKKIVFILILSFFIFGCNDDEESNTKSACGVENPVLDLTWLKNEIEQRENDQIEETIDWQYHYIMQVAFEKQDVFIYGNCDPLLNSVSPVYNCSGEALGFIGDENFPTDLFSTANIIWKGQGNQCNFSAM